MHDPKVGTNIKIESIKHDHSLHRRWENNKLFHMDEHVIIGANYYTEVTKGTGDRWKTRVPAVFYFDNRHWFNVIFLFQKHRPFYYCNLSSPFTFENNKIQYIDYDIDFIVQRDYSYRIVDRDEYQENKRRYQYPKEIEAKLKEAEKTIKKWINQRKAPFNHTFIEHWEPLFKECFSEGNK